MRPEEAWMLRQPRRSGAPTPRRCSIAAATWSVLTEIWMLRQPEHVRESYIREVLEGRLTQFAL